MVCRDDNEHHGGGGGGGGPDEPDGDTDQYEHDSHIGYSDLCRDASDQYRRHQLPGQYLYSKRGGGPGIDDNLTE
jgi:hypothetical protein